KRRPYRTSLRRNSPMEATAERDRRASYRRPIEQFVRYKVLENASACPVEVGRTVNMSRTGVLFTTESPLAMGQPVELDICWPLRKDGSPLALVIRGNVVRAEETQAVVAIDTHA